MTPHDFIGKWRNVELKERTASQSHFNDLCALLGVVDPITADPAGEWFTFEKGATKTGGGEGWADVWRKGAFAWEYKGPGKDLDKALQQLLRYARSLENPPLLIVSDMDRIRIHTNFTNTVEEVHDFVLDDLVDGSLRERLKQAFTDPDAFKPAKTRQLLTEEVAREFAALAQRLRDRGHNPQGVAHFVVRCAFCMFAEDVGLLPNNMFTRLVEEGRRKPDEFVELASELFRLMSKGGRLGLERVAWFNGGLFDNDAALPLNRVDIDLLYNAAKRHWSDIDPSILGTLFERGLDPGKRSQLGAHYTDRAKIELIVQPVIAEPLVAEWAALLKRAASEIEAAEASATAVRERAASHGELKAEVRELEGALSRRKHPDLFPDAPRQKLVRELTVLAAEVRSVTARVREAQSGVRATRDSFLARLREFRVLDPACGSGNFLYVALKLLKDIEHQVNVEAEALGVPLVAPEVGPANLLGIELNPFAAELARTSVWIGDIQWMRKNGFEPSRDPILKQLKTIECRDALLAEDGTRAKWPTAEVVVGNPPFLGGKRLRSELGDEYVGRLFAAYSNQVPQEADLVTYWIVKAWAAVTSGSVKRVGLVATNSVRGGANRRVIVPIADVGGLFAAWSDQPWTVDGAAVRVSLIAFGAPHVGRPMLNGQPVEQINADLTSATADLTKAKRLRANAGVAFMGDTKGGAFDIPGTMARNWLTLPLNPNGRSNADVLKPWVNGMDVTRRPADKWIIDFRWTMTESEAALYEGPFRHVLLFVQPIRATNKREVYARFWWRHVESRQGMWLRLQGKRRFIVTPTISKHRLFAWLSESVCPDHQLIVIARDDDVFFGILHSSLHELWSLHTGTSLEDRPRYTPSTTFETFPFPEGLTPDIPAADYADDPRAKAIATAAYRLNELRENWLNPADLVVREPEVVPGYPDRILPKDEQAAKELKKRTLTNLYNARPQWLANAHADLDRAVADAYGWGDDWRAGMTDDEILARLFALNQERE